MSKQQPELKQCLPPNWECKIDPFTQQLYYVNYKAEKTSWEPPEGTTYRPYSDDDNNKENDDVKVCKDDDVINDYEDVDDYDDLPPEWERKLDTRTGQQYFVNHQTKTTQWEDPREHCLLTLSEQKERSSLHEAICVKSLKDSDSRNSDLLEKKYYLKSVFPKAGDSLISLTLSKNSNDIEKASDMLEYMGFKKEDFVESAEQKLVDKIEASETPAPPPKTLEEIEALKQRLKEKYIYVADELIVIALESVDFNENNACQILDFMLNIEKEKNPSVSSEITGQPEIVVTKSDSKVASLSLSESRQSVESEKIVKDKISNKTSNYVQWTRQNKAIRKGPQGLAKGPNPSLLSTRSYQPYGPNPELREGPKLNLAKGSIYSQLKNNETDESPGN